MASAAGDEGAAAYYDNSKACKYLGKIYIDRQAGSRPPKDLVHKACRVVKKQAPAKNKAKIMFLTSQSGAAGSDGEERPALLIGCNEDDEVVVNVPLVTISAAGSIETLLYFATMEKKDEETCRYWVMVFKCKTEKRAFAIAENIILKCRDVHADYSSSQRALDDLAFGTARKSTLGAVAFSPLGDSPLNDSGASTSTAPSDSSILSMMDSPMSVLDYGGDAEANKENRAGGSSLDYSVTSDDSEYDGPGGPGGPSGPVARTYSGDVPVARTSSLEALMQAGRPLVAINGNGMGAAGWKKQASSRTTHLGQENSGMVVKQSSARQARSSMMLEI